MREESKSKTWIYIYTKQHIKPIIFLFTLSLFIIHIQYLLSTYFIEEQAEEDSRRTIKKLEQQLNELKGEHYSLVRENKEQSEKLNKELQNSINAHLTKNIILSYMTTSDPSVSFKNKSY